mmetsp:Transcript_18681/g.39573  ORF Transcript_18681/g.39573 Transcript_18681/m.39573 type:complete len:252 (-) Transcript_18681:721-1476(-)
MCSGMQRRLSYSSRRAACRARLGGPSRCPSSSQLLPVRSVCVRCSGVPTRRAPGVRAGFVAQKSTATTRATVTPPRRLNSPATKRSLPMTSTRIEMRIRSRITPSSSRLLRETSLRSRRVGAVARLAIRSVIAHPRRRRTARRYCMGRLACSTLRRSGRRPIRSRRGAKRSRPPLRRPAATHRSACCRCTPSSAPGQTSATGTGTASARGSLAAELPEALFKLTHLAHQVSDFLYTPTAARYSPNHSHPSP